MVVKPPLQSQCERLPIKGCGELVDGVLLYVQGDKQSALEKIEQARAQYRIENSYLWPEFDFNAITTRNRNSQTLMSSTSTAASSTSTSG